MLRKGLSSLSFRGTGIGMMSRATKTFQQATSSNLYCNRKLPARSFVSTPDHEYINFSLIGRPGSGKGTYGKLLSESLQCRFVVMGDVLRHHVQTKTVIGKEIAEYQREGRLADDQLVSKALLSHLEMLFDDRDYEASETKRSDGNSKLGFILDGFPRTVQQAEASIFWPEKFSLSFAVNIDVPDSVCLDKMLGRRKCTICNESLNVSDVNTIDGFVMPPKLPSPFPCDQCDMDQDWEMRVDDTEEVILRRIAEFNEKSAPVSKFFQERGELVNFVPYNGVADINKMENLVKERI